MARRKISKVVKAAVLNELQKGTPRKEVSETYSVAQSTLTRWAQEAGIEAGTSSSYRTPPTLHKELEPSADPTDLEERRKTLSTFAAIINDALAEPGLRTVDIKNLIMAQKSLGDSLAKLREDEQAETIGAQGANGAAPPKTVEDLVASRRDGSPRNIDAYFSVCEVLDMRQRGTKSQADEAWRTMAENFMRYGIYITEELFQRAVDKIDADYDAERRRLGEGEKERLEAWALTTPLSSEADDS